MRPVVGITGNSYLIDDSYPVQACGMHNIEAVSKVSNATALIVPASPDFNTIDELCAMFDGFVFTGARPNVHPEEYGEEATAAHGDFDRDRDGLTLPLIRACVERGIPILGICRGFQEFNVAFGGTLYPEIRDLPGRMNHRMPPDGTIEEKFALRHDINLEKGGAFEAIWGTDVVRTNSLHGQGIKDAGERIVIEGYAPDGTPEAIRVEGASGFALAVQWHPEWQAGIDTVSKPLFEAFGQAMSTYRANRMGAQAAAE
ncbi:gamma-glutamyl-gamma-aminobutyrate hydrolase family protein [Amylibacter sp. IMCC11727]|uniref:gamma-glutamyl-gamma-aminobutyrate hydrolase family protein n=1 Tax=Amylibacter sp. IMCC11727 TaxID=3039851 RepID=UPI00244DE93F|nr:gamma-glutamyl-gamma-aminobutyrate hydrolase family protein [Amylibacter sp. IMCC11727]WGI21048.1 gamma-glutamyl-gamma-aminobutyrate hydrolase family protein [Amylibacter sp. IMCC11727]